MVCFSGGDRCRGILTDHSDPLKHEYKRPDIVPLLFFIPYLLPAIGVFKGWEWLYEGNFGLFNFVLRMMGLPKQRFLDDPNQVIPVWCLSPYGPVAT